MVQSYDIALVPACGYKKSGLLVVNFVRLIITDLSHHNSKSNYWRYWYADCPAESIPKSVISAATRAISLATDR